jgi:hypothetical protein
VTKSKLIFIILLAVIIGIQFIEIEMTNPPVLADIETPMEIKTILQKSCYDCHSNETRWPWYSKFAPVSWFVADDVNEGRKHLNFSDWEKLTTDKQVKLIGEITDEITEGSMPLKKYTILHPGSSLDLAKQQALEKWFHESGK